MESFDDRVRAAMRDKKKITTLIRTVTGTERVASAAERTDAALLWSAALHREVERLSAEVADLRNSLSAKG